MPLVYLDDPSRTRTTGAISPTLPPEDATTQSSHLPKWLLTPNPKATDPGSLKHYAKDSGDSMRYDATRNPGNNRRPAQHHRPTRTPPTSGCELSTTKRSNEWGVSVRNARVKNLASQDLDRILAEAVRIVARKAFIVQALQICDSKAQVQFPLEVAASDAERDFTLGCSVCADAKLKSL